MSLRTDLPDPQRLLWETHSAFADVQSDAYRTKSGALSFDQLHKASLALTCRLQALPDAAARRPVLIWGHKDLRYPVAYWACLLAGMALVPVEPDTPAERLRQIAQSCDACAVLIASDTPGDANWVAEQTQALDLPVLSVDPFAAPGVLASRNIAKAQTSADDVAYIMFSSGTLGQPKGIQVTYANLADFILWLDDLLPETSFRAVTGNIRHCFDVSLFEIWTSWRRLLPITSLDHSDFAVSTSYIQRLAADQTGLWVSTPSIARLLLRNHRFNGEVLPHLGVFLFCGEALTKPIVAELFSRFPGCRVVNTYGPTECTVAVTSVDITQAHLDAPVDLPIGYARPGTEMAAIRATTAGEIEIRGACVGRGYLKLPEKQAKAFPEPGCYRTGDRGHQTEDGLWHFGGRIDREVKVQGVRIDLDDVEAHIRRQPGVEDAVVDTYVLRGEPRALNAYVIGATDDACLQRLAETLARDLPPYLVPRFWYAGFSTCLNKNSKLDRSRLSDVSKSAAFRHVHALPRAMATS